MPFKAIKYFWHLAVPGLLLSLFACGPQKDGFMAMRYHNTTSYFNGFYHAKQEYREGIAQIESGETVPTDGFLPLLQTAEGTNSTARFDTAIKKCDVVIFKHPKSKWMDDARFLNGRCYYYKGNYSMAKTNFNYIIQEFEDSKIIPEVKLWLAKTYYVTGNEYRANEVLKELPDFDKIGASTRVEIAKMRAQLFIERKQYSEAAGALQEVLGDLKGRREKARINFVLGQLFAAMKGYDRAVDYYNKVAKLDYSNELTFRALLGIAQLYADPNNPDSEAGLAGVQTQLKKLLDDIKYQNYHDQIYYQFAQLEKNKNNTEGALDNLRKSVQANTGNQRQLVLSLYDAGKIFFYEQQKLDSAQAYFNQAASAVQPEMPEHDEIKTIAAVLTDYVKYRNDIQVNDSLLALGSKSEADIKAHIKAQLEREEAERRKREAEERRRQQEMQRQMMTQAQMNINDPLAQQNMSGFYFEDQMQIARGKGEFIRVWGRRPNQDNWRRKNKMQLAGSDEQEDDRPEETMEEKIERLFAEVPRSQAERDSANQTIQTAYFELGQIMTQSLELPDSGLKYYRDLVERYPDGELTPKALYAIYNVYALKGAPQAGTYKARILRDYPNSPYARLLRKERITDDENSGSFVSGYEGLLDQYSNEQYETVVNFGGFLREEHQNHPEVYLIDYLRGASMGELGRKQDMKKAYEQIVASYPETDVGRVAQLTLDMMAGKSIAVNPSNPSSKSTVASSAADERLKEKRFRGFEVSQRANEPIFAVVFVDRDRIKNSELSAIVSDFNKEKFPERQLRANAFFYKTDSVQKWMLYISQFPDYPTGDQYVQAIKRYPKLATLMTLPGIDAMFISPANFRVAFSQKRFHDYQAFYSIFKDKLLANGRKEEN